MIQLILGGARSGKSRYAEQQVTLLQQQHNLPVTYIATATNIDEEMAQRIQRHQQDRPKDWQLQEISLQVAEYLHTANQQNQSEIILIDCLTLWLNNQLYHYPEQHFETLIGTLTAALTTASAAETAQEKHLILVANEVGLGVIPMGATTRKFVDWSGWMNQAVAQIADEVTFIAAGLPLYLKSRSAPLINSTR